MKMSNEKHITFLVSFILVLNLIEKLNSVDPCKHDVNKKGIIDLTTVSRVNGTPQWKNLDPETIDGHGNSAYHIIF